MSKIVAILFSSLILVQSLNISFEDVSKLSVLMEHAEYHEKAYGDTFLDFLGEHYGNSKFQHGSDHEEHQDLPFKHSHQTCVHANAAFTFQVVKFNLEYTTFTEIPFNFFYKESTSLFEKPSVFQPPRLA
ncbi:hypothetical protein A9Q87_09755 [Flavobacteriales bacterium 34_180_T64]|nr:hypothetical protein A9Q87_09755 [Flavobacteriales bacterium 34_180_T64]